MVHGPTSTGQQARAEQADGDQQVKGPGDLIVMEGGMWALGAARRGDTRDLITFLATGLQLGETARTVPTSRFWEQGVQTQGRVRCRVGG
jgi:hypothetical protein